MKHKPIKHVLAALLVFCMVLTMLPVSALAATNVTPTPTQDSNKTIPVEYFTSTLYDWDESGANNATAAADFKEGERGEYHVKWSEAATYNNAPIPTGVCFYAYYAVKVDGNYYPAYGRWENDDQTSCSLYYKANGGNPAGSYNSPEQGGLIYVTTCAVSDKNAYITDPTGKFAIEKVDDQENVVIFYGESENGHYEGKGFYFTQSEDIPADIKNNDNLWPTYSRWLGGQSTKGDGLFADDKYFPNTNITFQSFYIYSGLAEKNLKEAENAPFSNDINAADLFSTEEYDWKDVYTNVKVPYYVDEDGYYVLNSDTNAVYFENGKAQSDATMKIADLPACYQWNFMANGFQPLNNLTANQREAYKSTSAQNPTPAYQISGGSTTGFGMVTEVKFQMTDDGKDANGKDITFEFSGDDDVWVYIDDKLALDVGGTHGAILGTINFATGEVALSSPAYGRIGDLKGRTGNAAITTDEVKDLGTKLTQQNLYGDDGVFGTTLTGFSAQGEHTLKIYYMERGKSRTNCLIKFNLPQRDTVEVTKKLDHAKSDTGVLSDLDPDEIEIYNAREFGFTLYEDGKAVANKTYYLYDSDNNLIRTASTDAAGHFTLHRNETARFLVDIGEDNSFYVVEDEMTKEKDGFLTPTWTYTTKVTEANVTEDANGFTGMTVTATGSETAADSISFVCENYLSSNIPNPGILPQGERIVIDYGLPITMNVSDLLANDIIRGDETTFSLTDNGGDFGTAVYTDVGNDGDYTNDTITYTLNKQLTGIETLTYTITVTGSGNQGNEQTSETATANANVQIMPATSMYYEENFGGTSGETKEGDPVVYGLVSYSNATTKWNSVGTANGGNQETGFVGTIGDSTYGSDTVYLTGIGDSYGTSMYADTSNKAAQFVYDFTGTGTAIYGRVSPTTGYIRVVVTDSDGNTADTKFIDTVELANVGSAEELYNIPIYLNNTFAHGDYHVEVLVYKAGAATTNGNGAGADFYLDGIRIYNPVVNNSTVNTAYADDGEANTVVLNIRDKILGDNSNGYLSDEFFTLTDVNGKVIKNDKGEIVEQPGGDTEKVDDYAAYGPNHEFYLNNEKSENEVYTVSFKLINWNSTYYKLYLGMKAPATAASVTVGGTVINLNNSADCYYDISEYVSVSTEGGSSVGTVTISGNEGLASLTNIKVTGVDAFTLGSANDFEKNGGNPGDVELASPRMLYMVPMTYSLSEDTEEPIPDETVPEEPIPEEPIPDEEEPVEVFAPKYLKVDCSYIRLLKTATVVVTASSDVSYVTVDGARVSGTSLLGVKVFVCTESRVQSGETFEVIAYNSDGVASASYTATAK